MQFPKFPDWLLYASVAGAILLVANVRREDADAPPPPPPVPGEADTPLDPALPFDPAEVVDIPHAAAIATAFSVAERGVWLTSSQAVRGCPRLALGVAEGRGVRAKVAFADVEDMAILTTAGGGRPLALRGAAPLRSGERGFMPGFPAGPGEVSARFLAPGEPAYVWAETGRTEGLTHGLAALAGAPVLDETGRVAGLVLSSSTRRGVFEATGPGAVSHALAKAGQPPAQGEGRTVDITNYARVADELRRDLSVVAVTCLN